MSSEADVIRLVQRADWTRLSLTMEMNDGSRVLLAPGRRYREQTLDGLRGCDGERPWRMPEPETDRWASVRDADPRHQGVTPLKVAGVVAREVGKEVAKAARSFLRRLGPP